VATLLSAGWPLSDKPITATSLLKACTWLAEQARIEVKQSGWISGDSREIRMGRVEQIIVLVWYGRGSDFEYGRLSAINPPIAERL
jgi:hypothetical protein